MIVGKIAVVNQSFIQADERVCAAGMPDSSLGGITLMGNPSMGFKILQAVILGHLLGIADDF